MRHARNLLLLTAVLGLQGAWAGDKLPSNYSHHSIATCAGEPDFGAKLKSRLP